MDRSHQWNNPDENQGFNEWYAVLLKVLNALTVVQNIFGRE